MILNLVGKHNKIRTVPVASWVKVSVDQWTEIAGITSGVLFPRIIKGGRIQATRMTSQAIWGIVKEYSPIPHLAPHDIRRTFAKLSRKGGAQLEQIQHSLGHESIATTERYVNSIQDLQDAPSDYIKIDIDKGDSTCQSKN